VSPLVTISSISCLLGFLHSPWYVKGCAV